VRGVLPEAALAENGLVRTAELDDGDPVSYDAAPTDAARMLRPTLSAVFSARSPGYARPSGGASYTDVDVEGS